MNSEKQPSQEDLWHNDPKNWKLGMFYYNKQDTRVFVPKRIQWMGITFNFARSSAYFYLIGMAVFFGFIVYMIERRNH